MFDRAAALLAMKHALVELKQIDARKVVNYMHPEQVAAGTVLMREGDKDRSDSMALIIAGEVTVESVTPTDDLVVSVLGSGGLIGEMGLIDQGARSATCTATTDVVLAVLTRKGLTRMIEEQPAVAARLLMIMCKNIADHLRETNRKLLTMARVSRAMQQELDATHAINRRLLERPGASGVKTPA